MTSLLLSFKDDVSRSSLQKYNKNFPILEKMNAMELLASVLASTCKLRLDNSPTTNTGPFIHWGGGEMLYPFKMFNQNRYEPLHQSEQSSCFVVLLFAIGHCLPTVELHCHIYSSSYFWLVAFVDF